MGWKWVNKLSLALAMVWMPALALAECPTVVGDVNGDGEADVVDVQCTIVSVLYAQSPTLDPSLVNCLGGPDNLAVSDLSCSGGTNVVDVLLSLSFALGESLNPEVDEDANGCPDSCEAVPLAPSDIGAPEPIYTLEDVQPDSAGYLTSYGLGEVEGVTVVVLLASW